MRNKNILKALSLIAAVCIAAGCNGSAIAETTTTTITTTASNTVETTTLTEKADKDLLLVELGNGVEMNGKKYSIPFTLEDLGNEYNATGADTEYDIFYKNEYYAFITVDESDDFSKANVNAIQFTSNTDFKLGDIYCGNSRNNIYQTYGEPDMKAPSEKIEHYIFDNGVVFGIEYDNNVIVSLGIEFSK